MAPRSLLRNVALQKSEWNICHGVAVHQRQLSYFSIFWDEYCAPCSQKTQGQSDENCKSFEIEEKEERSTDEGDSKKVRGRVEESLGIPKRDFGIDKVSRRRNSFYGSPELYGS
jgi:hypothetical protein